MLVYPQNFALVDDAAAKGKGGATVLMLRVLLPDTDETRLLFRTGKVMDIVPCPYSDDATQQLFAALEAGDTSLLG
jgi:hypothetical protein